MDNKQTTKEDISMANYNKLIGLGVTIGGAVFGILGDRVKDRELNEKIEKEVQKQVSIALKQHFESR